jgi:uncharacterized protein (TIGR03118 family)
MMTHRIFGSATACCLSLFSSQLYGATLGFFQTNLASDLPGVAQNLDANLANPWGIAFGPTTPIWIADNHTGMSTVYNGAGQPFPAMSPIQVTIPPPGGGTSPAAPTGIVFTNTGFGGSHFLFATEDGTIAAWTSGSSAALEVDKSASGAVYKGLARVGTTLYAANFNSGNIDVFDTTFAPITVSGGFVDPTIPSGFAPFDIQNINGLLYVTYAKQDAMKHDDAAGPGNGFVDIFDANGALQQRLISNGPLNSPWGLALAPAGFGPFGGDLLVGNFGDGKINAFDPNNGNFLGILTDANGDPIVNTGLWGLAFGNGSQGANTNALYFTAGIPGPDMVEDHGLFGDIQAVPEPASVWLFCCGLLTLLSVAARARVRSSKASPSFIQRDAPRGSSC